MVNARVNYIILGATGSIGTQALDIIRINHDRLVAFSYGYNTNKALEIIEEFKPLYVSTLDKTAVEKIHNKYPEIIVYCTEEGNNKIASLYPNEAVVINALVGSAGLKPTSMAIKANHDILLANKETLVIGGEIIKKLSKEHNVKLIPIDSEHSAIYQLLKGQNKKEINKIILTASGGPFRKHSKEELENVKVEDALKHPNWSMGRKITIDSSTLVNKGLELRHYLNNIVIEGIINERDAILNNDKSYRRFNTDLYKRSKEIHTAIGYIPIKDHEFIKKYIDDYKYHR